MRLRRRVIDVQLPEPEESAAAQREAIRWLVNRAIRLGDTKSAENCVGLAYEIDEKAAAAEIARRRRRRK